MWLEFLRWAHVIGATVLLGTGTGIAFFMVMANHTRDAKLVAHTAGTVVLADWVFTASAVVVQPITGALLAHKIGWPLFSGWVFWSLLLYIFVGCFWLPVVWIQHKMHALAREAIRLESALPQAYYRLYRIWVFCGIPAFTAVLAIVWMMMNKPVL